MNRIDRLIIKAKHSIGTELVFAFVERCGEQWKTAVHLSRKEQCPPEICESLHATDEEAIEHICAMAEKYPNSRDITIIVDDMPG